MPPLAVRNHTDPIQSDLPRDPSRMVMGDEQYAINNFKNWRSAFTSKYSLLSAGIEALAARRCSALAALDPLWVFAFFRALTESYFSPKWPKTN